MSHAGTVLLADRIGLTAALSEATDGLRERRAGHDPGRVLVDVAVAIADGARSISDVQSLADQEGLHGPSGSVASTATIWRVLAGIDGAMLAEIRRARAVARDRAWLARGELTGSELPGSRGAGRLISQTVLDLDATLVTAHSDKEGAKGTFKGGFGYHPLGAWLDNTGEALAAVLRPGNAGSNTATDHLQVLEQAEPVAGPVAGQADPGPRGRRRLLPRTDPLPFRAGAGVLDRLPGHRQRPGGDQAGVGLALAGRVQRRRGPA